MAALHGEADVILERAPEAAALASHIEGARQAEGRVAVVQGPAGIGKSRLLQVARAQATTTGLTVGAARGSGLEQDFPYGGVRQLFEPLVAALDDPDQVFTGAAAAARAVVGTVGPAPEHPGEVLHGLFWLTANLAERCPLALICDDAHWLDGPTLRYLAYLGHRIAELPCVLIIGTRLPEPGPEGDLLDETLAEHRHHVLRLQPLSPTAVTDLVRHELGAATDDDFCRAVADASGGNPFLAVELLRTVRAHGIVPDAAGALSLAALGAGSIVATRLGRLPEEALEVARAVAVLGGDAQVRLVAALTSFDVERVATIADQLIRAEVLGPERPLSFVHPLVAAAVYNDLMPGDRSARHLRAARLLDAEGAAPERVATHLLATDPAADDWAVRVLLAAARASGAQGASDTAIAYFRRALAEPPDPADRLSVLLELGTSETLISDPGAAGHLELALDGLRDMPEISVPLTVAYAVALVLEGDDAAAVGAFDDLDSTLVGRDDLVLESLAGSVVVAMTGRGAARSATSRVTRLRDTPVVGATPLVRGVRSFIGALANEPGETMAELASASLADTPADDLSRWMWFHLPLTVLVMTDRRDEASMRIEEGLVLARRLGAPVHTAVTLTVRAWLAQRTGNLADVEADALAAIEALRLHRNDLVLPGPLALLVDVARERGDLDGADVMLERWGYMGEPGPSLFNLFLLRARGRLRLAQGRTADAVADLRRGKQHYADLSGTSPAFHAWGAHLARALAADPATRSDACDEAHEAFELATAFGAPRAIAICRLALADVEGDVRPETFSLAVAEFRRAGDRLGEAQASLRLGLALGATGVRAPAVEALAGAIDLAQACGATSLSAQAQTELVAAGGAPRKRAVEGVGALTPSEQRVAALAVAGQTNRGIAESLFLSIKTVETHLAHVYQKLSISGRAELATALAGDALPAR